MTRVVVTGGSGKVGRACVKDLLEHGYEVFNVDTVPPASNDCPFVQADLADFGQAFEVLSRGRRPVGQHRCACPFGGDPGARQEPERGDLQG